jgi:hypothetical protein
MTISLDFINSVRAMLDLPPIRANPNPEPEPGVTKRQMRLARRDVSIAKNPYRGTKPKRERKGQRRATDGLTKYERNGLLKGKCYVAHGERGRLIVVPYPPGKTVVGSQSTGPIRNLPCPCGSGKKVKHCPHDQPDRQVP